MLISQANKDLHIAMRTIGLFSLPSSLASASLSTILDHPTFFPGFITTTREKLIRHYHICTRVLRRYGIPYIPSNAGFFIWIDLTKYLDKIPGEKTPLEKERELNQRILDGGVHLATSEAFYGEEFGWFRITFTVDEMVLGLALSRLMQIIGADELDGTEMQKLRLRL